MADDNLARQCAALLKLGTATIHEAQGQKGAVDPALKPIDSAMRVAGPALTVRCRPGDNLALHYALTKARPGQVVVVDAEGFLNAGPWGDVMSTAAMLRGVAGLVIDGAVRDAQAITDLGFPVFSRGVCIRGTNKYQPGVVGEPIVLGGVVVRTGDVVVGDRDGVVVVLQEEVASALAASQAREDKEATFREQLRSGRTTVELINLGPILDSYGMK
ncbi:MAG: RraA family protein [Comamonadaceae bacterium]|nr:MAG: RraA family protein [Comamonadaceae bacterium]